MTMAHTRRPIVRTRCMSCFLIGMHLDSCQDHTTQLIVMPRPMDDGLAHTLVMEASEIAGEPPARDARGLLGPVVAIALGLPLMAIGSVFRHEVATVVWSWLH